MVKPVQQGTEKVIAACNQISGDLVSRVMGREASADEAFTDFAASSQSRLRNTAYLLCGDWERASDYVQEGLVRVYVAWPRIKRQGGELAYARKAVLCAFLDSNRKRSSRERPASQLPDRPSSSDVAEAVTDRAALMAALALLPQRQRACVVLRYFEELDVRETSVALGCSEGTVKSQTSRALDSMRSLLKDTSLDDIVVAGQKDRS